MEKLPSSPDTDGTLTAEKQRGFSAQSFGTASDGEDEAVFQTCVSLNTEGTFGSPASSRPTTSRKLNLDATYDRPRRSVRSETTDNKSERGSCRSDVRGFLNIIYGEHQKRTSEQHQRSKRCESQAGSKASNIVTTETEGTPKKRRGESREADGWAASRHSALEQLRVELEKRLGDHTQFKPELREARVDESGATVASVEVQYPSRAMETTLQKTDDIAGAPYVHDKATLNYLTIELSNLRDTVEEDHDGTKHRLEEKSRERRERTEEKWRAKERAECTFHPQISPTSDALFHKSSHEKGDVFHRLYPHQQTGKASPEEGLGEQELLEKEEMESLRERCGALTASQVGDGMFELFLHNVLGPSRDRASAYVETDYRSPLAQRLQAEGLLESLGSADRKNESFREDRRYRIACFDEFLQRQNAHYGNRSRGVRNLERALKPSFKPEISETSVQIAKELRARSVITTPEVGNVSVLASAVKKHRSPYVDPCTFKPKITAVSSSMKPRGVNSMANDGVRWRKARKVAQEKALAEELRHPFRPTLNDERNAHVESLLHPKNYTRYEQCLRQHKERLEQMKQEKDAMREREELGRSTFRPKTTRKPAYVARMASSFALVRQKYGEL
ncbi:hypothetical protein DQ04_00091280 [Trypanosoma grayi]|uniref:hypothetical protein n=1 Tax=Trypanosoma grayi TaxID=71804 RepID=UPI0004F4AABD|nr:hypothetical protein DQ04_00091280 [Trypanosoma grayi]KEG15394.1 hypothetical protein DQ04_00091280 [Trypanosoma grayi]